MSSRGSKTYARTYCNDVKAAYQATVAQLRAEHEQELYALTKISGGTEKAALEQLDAAKKEWIALQERLEDTESGMFWRSEDRRRKTHCVPHVLTTHAKHLHAVPEQLEHNTMADCVADIPPQTPQTPKAQSLISSRSTIPKIRVLSPGIGPRCKARVHPRLDMPQMSNGQSLAHTHAHSLERPCARERRLCASPVFDSTAQWPRKSSIRSSCNGNPVAIRWGWPTGRFFQAQHAQQPPGRQGRRTWQEQKRRCRADAR